jgi:hypothetical protein
VAARRKLATEHHSRLVKAWELVINRAVVLNGDASSLARIASSGRIGSVWAIRTLVEDDHSKFETLSSKVNNLARTLYHQVRDALEKQYLSSGEVKKRV